MPLTTSFPSGHAASAFAFATGVTRKLPIVRHPNAQGGVACSRETLRVNVTGTFLVCRDLLPAMVQPGRGAARRGAVIVIGSTTAKRPLYGRTPYAASEAALVGWWRWDRHVRREPSIARPAGFSATLRTALRRERAIS